MNRWRFLLLVAPAVAVGIVTAGLGGIVVERPTAAPPAAEVKPPVRHVNFLPLLDKSGLVGDRAPPPPEPTPPVKFSGDVYSLASGDIHIGLEAVFPASTGPGATKAEFRYKPKDKSGLLVTGLEGTVSFIGEGSCAALLFLHWPGEGGKVYAFPANIKVHGKRGERGAANLALRLTADDWPCPDGAFTVRVEVWGEGKMDWEGQLLLHTKPLAPNMN